MTAPNDTQRPLTVVSHSDNKGYKNDHVGSFADSHTGPLESAVLAPTFSKRIQKGAMLKVSHPIPMDPWAPKLMSSILII